MLITGAKDPWLVFWRDLDRFKVAPCSEVDDTIEDTNSHGRKPCFTHEIPRSTKEQNLEAIGKTNIDTTRIEGIHCFGPMDFPGVNNPH